jgi:hypothetical protein
MKETLIFVLTFITVQFIVWYGGADIFERSASNAYILVVSLFIAWLGSIFTDLFL